MPLALLSVILFATALPFNILVNACFTAAAGHLKRIDNLIAFRCSQWRLSFPALVEFERSISCDNRFSTAGGIALSNLSFTPFYISTCIVLSDYYICRSHLIIRSTMEYFLKLILHLKWFYLSGHRRLCNFEAHSNTFSAFSKSILRIIPPVRLPSLTFLWKKSVVDAALARLPSQYASLGRSLGLNDPREQRAGSLPLSRRRISANKTRRIRVVAYYDSRRGLQHPTVTRRSSSSSSGSPYT